MVSKLFERCLTYLTVIEMQCKTTLRFHLTPVRTVIIRNANGKNCWHGRSEGKCFGGSVNECKHFGKQSGGG